MTGHFRIFFLPKAAAALVAVSLTATPAAATQGFPPQTPADIQTQPSFLATPAFARLAETKSIVVITTRGRAYEGHFTISGHTLVLRRSGSFVTVPFEQVARVEKSTFRIRTHARIGLGIGAVVGALIAADACEGSCKGDPWFPVFAAALGGGLGTDMGARNGAKLNAWYGGTDIVYDINWRGFTSTATPLAFSRWRTPSFADQVEGKDVWITTVDGVNHRGRIALVTGDGLTLTGQQPASVPFDQIATIVEVSHRLRNGVVSGLAAGASVSLLTPLGRGCDGNSVCAKKALGLTAVGVGTGVLVAAVMNRQKDFDLLYDSGRKKTMVSIAPILSSTRKGMAFSMSWR
jgi:hypothetical protein